MTDLRKAAEMALDALETIKSSCREGRTAHAENEAAIVEYLLRQALAQPEQEPTSVKHMVSWIDYLKGFSDNGIHMKIQSGLSAGDCYRLAVELEQFINRTHVDAVNTSQERVDETAKREHEPVGYIDGMYGGYMVFTPINPSAVYLNGTALYTAPPKREWVGLSDEEVAELHYEIKKRLMGTYKTDDIYRAIEAKLKEKNT